MAVLNATQLAEGRRQVAAKLAADGTPINFTKSAVNAAFQATEDWFNASTAALVTAINAATTPTVLSGAQKTAVIAVWAKGRAVREGV